jgi:sarcosine oxidase, subunit beta
MTSVGQDSGGVGRSRDAVRSLPHEADVVIIGGGVTGAATAYYLADSHLSVVLVEESDLNTKASGRNAGSLHAQMQMDPFRERGLEWARDYIPALSFLVDSIEMWKGLGAELGAELEVATNGGLYVADSDEQVELLKSKVEVETQAGLAAELVTGGELRRLAPYLSPNVIAAQLSPNEGKTNPLLAASAYARAAARAGLPIFTHTNVLDVRRNAGAFEVVTEKGSIAAGKVVLATGALLPQLGIRLGLHLPVTEEPVQVSATEAAVKTVPHLVYYAGGRLTFKQAVAGTILIGGGWPARIDPATGNPAVSMTSLRGNLHIASRVVPWVLKHKVIRTWAGVGCSTPDLMPYLGEASVPGLFIGMFPHMGMTGGPLMGHTLAQLVRGETVARDLTPFRPDRFEPAAASAGAGAGGDVAASATQQADGHDTEVRA